MAEWRRLESPDAPKAVGGYSQAVEVRRAERTLYVSGQIPVDVEGRTPVSFADQASLVWRNLEAQLRAADMSLDNLAKVTIFLSDRRYSDDNRRARDAALGERSPALTVIIIGIFDPAWLLEIEAVAVA